MNDIHQIRRLNNSAATSLADGDIEAALSVLRLALEDLRLDLVAGNGTDIHLNAARPALDPFVVPIHQSLRRNDHCVSPDNAFHVFKKAFVMPEPESDIDGVAVILLYNFGLSLQRKGLITGQMNLFVKAGKIYEMATSLLEMMESRGRASSQIVALALWNNLGHSQSHMICIDKIRECRERIRYYLSRGHELEGEDLAFFHHTILFLDNCDLASLAAAA